jgi:hypothetical protein
MAIPNKMATGIPDTGTARADVSAAATWKPAAAVAAERATPGSKDGGSVVVFTGVFGTSFSFFSSEGMEERCLVASKVNLLEPRKCRRV